MSKRVSCVLLFVRVCLEGFILLCCALCLLWWEPFLHALAMHLASLAAAPPLLPLSHPSHRL